ncbi:variant leucine-rich repeat-containing protein [Deinococcus terrestris]|nr:hypothetical protein [Deinococcus terrestris]
MPEKELYDIGSYFDHSDETMDLAEKAAPGATYLGGITSVEAEYDDDSGYYLIETEYYEGLYDKDKQELRIQDPVAYESFFSRVKEYFSPLEDEEDSDDNDYDEPGEHVGALEMVRRTGWADDLALQLLYQDRDLVAACESVPEILNEAVRLAISKEDRDLVAEMIDDLVLDAEAIDRILEFDVTLGGRMLDQHCLRAEHLITIYQALKLLEGELDLDQMILDPRCPTALLEQLAAEFPEAQAQLEDREAYLTRVMQEPNPNDPIGDLVFVAQDSATPLASLLLLSGHGEWEVRAGVAENPHTPVELLERLANDDDWRVQGAVVSNPSTPTLLFEQLAASEGAVRTVVAAQPRATPDTLARLAQDQWQAVRRAVAGNPNTPLVILAQLARDQDWTVRKAVAGNLSATSELLEHLSTDKDGDVRLAVAGNPGTPPEVLAHLASDKDRYRGADIRRAVAGNPRTSPEVVARLT